MLVLGATSGIGRALCHVMAQRGCHLLLAGRDWEQVQKDAADLSLRYQNEAFPLRFEALDYESHPAFFARCVEHFGGQLDGVVLCYGYMTGQAETEADFSEARLTVDVNFTSAISILNLAATYLMSRGRGYVAAISSVAGDRGRGSNYTYGAAKAGLTIYLQGLRNRLHRAGVSVLTIKPGFVDTPMTQGLVNPNSLLVASPERVARDIDAAIRRRKNVLYTPWFWSWIMRIIRAIPESIFKRLSL